MSTQNERRTGGLSALAPSLLMGLVLTFLCIACSAALVYFQQWDDTAIPPLAFACMGFGAWVTAFFTARHCASHRFFTGLLGSLCLYACILALGITWVGMPMDTARMGLGVATALGAGALGAALGSLRKKRYRGKHNVR